MSTALARLERECGVFTRFLTRQAPTPYVCAKYVAAHEVVQLAPSDGMNRLLVRAAGWSPGMTRIADAYARVTMPRSTLRRKLVTLLAILEVSPPFHRALSAAPTRTLLATLGALVRSGIVGALTAVLGVLVFAPVHMALVVWRKRS